MESVDELHCARSSRRAALRGAGVRAVRCLVVALAAASPTAALAEPPPLPAAGPAQAPAPSPSAPLPATPEAPAPAASSSAEPDASIALPPVAPGMADSAPLPRHASASQTDTARQNLMLVTGGLSLVGLGLGGVFGGLSISRWGDVKDAAQQGCLQPAMYKGCTQQVGDLQVQASSFATVSTFCFLAGTAALAGTILLWATGRRDEVPMLGIVSVAPAVGPQGGGGLLTGSF